MSESTGADKASETDTTHSRKKDPFFRLMVITGGGVVLVWGLFGFLPWFAQEGSPWNLRIGLPGKAAEFGDSFGFINSIFSALAFAGVIVAIKLQSEELAAQREELKLTRQQMEESVKAQQESQRELARQAKSNMNTTLLSALQGMQSYADSKKDEETPEERAQGVWLRKLTNRLRMEVLESVISDIEIGGLAETIKREMLSWRNLVLVARECRMLDETAEIALKRPSGKLDPELYPYDIDVRSFSDVETRRYEELKRRFDNVSFELQAAFRTTGDDFEPFCRWRQLADEVAAHDNGLNALHRLKNFQKLCENTWIRAEQSLKMLS